MSRGVAALACSIVVFSASTSPSPAGHRLLFLLIAIGRCLRACLQLCLKSSFPSSSSSRCASCWHRAPKRGLACCSLHAATPCSPSRSAHPAGACGPRPSSNLDCLRCGVTRTVTGNPALYRSRRNAKASPYPFITDEQFDRLQANGRLARAYQEKDEHFDPLPVVKLFTPDAGGTWLLTEIDDEARTAFGLCGAPHKPNYVKRAVMWTVEPYRGVRCREWLHITTTTWRLRASRAIGRKPL